MNNVIKEVEKLKEDILNSDEYKEFKKYEIILDNSKEINTIITNIKRLQQQIIKKEDKGQDTDKEEIELQSLYKELNTYDDYVKYIESSKKFNELITYIQKEFENYFNQFII